METGSECEARCRLIIDAAGIQSHSASGASEAVIYNIVDLNSEQVSEFKEICEMRVV